MRYYFKTYIVNDREYFEFGETDDGAEILTERKLPAYKKDFPLMESLVSFFYLDVNELEAICKPMQKALREYDPHSSQEIMMTVRSGLNTLAEKHIFFALLRCRWACLLDLAEKGGNDLPVKEISHLPSEVAERQQRIEELFRNVLLFDPKEKKIPERFAAYGEDAARKRQRLFPFRKLTVGFEQVSPTAFTEVLYPEDIYDLVDFYLRECIRREIPMRRCKNCGRWFALTGHQGWEYCDRVFDEKGRTCRDVGAVNTWTAKRSEDEVFKVYRREYKKRFGWIKAGKIPAEDFYQWSEQARRKKQACDKGEITLEEFEAWLKKR